MKTKKTEQMLKMLPLLVVVTILLALATGCRTSMGSGVKGHRGGIATGVKGTTRAIDPSSDWVGTRFEVHTKRGQIMPLNEGKNPDHFVVDTKDDWDPITVVAIFIDGQVQRKTLNWSLNGVGVTAYVGANAGLAAAVGIGSIPSIAGDAITHAAYDLDVPRPHFVHQNGPVTQTQPQAQANPITPPSPATPVYAPAPNNPPPGTPGITADQLMPRAMPTTLNIIGMNIGANASQAFPRVNIGGIGTAPQPSAGYSPRKTALASAPPQQQAEESRPIVINGK